MDSQKSYKISDIVLLKRMIKRWRKRASSSKPALALTNNINNNDNINHKRNKSGNLSRSASSKGITFLRRTLSLPDLSSTNGAPPQSSVRKGYMAVDVGEEMKRFTIPTSYLTHQAFASLLKEAEEEFGFQQEGVLRIPCEVVVFEQILRGVQAKTNSNAHAKQVLKFRRNNEAAVCGSSTEGQIPQPQQQHHYPPSPMCR